MKKDVLGWVALAAAIVGTASAEYELARACGFGQFVAATVPAALDVYAIRAYRQHRDGLAVLVAMIVVNALSHLVTANLIPVNVPLVVAVASLAPLVMWRVHRLHGAADHAEGHAEPVTPAVSVVYPEAGYVPERVPAAVDTPLPAPSTSFVGAFDKAPKSGPLFTSVEPLYPLPELEGNGGSGGGVPEAEYVGGYVPEAVPDPEVHHGYAVPGEPLDELTEQARKEFADLLDDGRTPSIRQLRDTYSIGQPRAQLIQRQFLT